MYTHARSRSLLFTADHAAIASAVPSVPVEGQGYNVAARHTEAATLKLRELGFPAPSPIASYYDWPKFKGRFAPFEHQKLTSEFLTFHRRCFVLNELGTGKTNAVLWAMDWLMSEGKVNKALVVSPLSTLERVWLMGVMETVMHRRVVVVHGSREKRLKLLATDAEVYIINHDGLSIGPVREAIMARKDIDLVVVDEGSKFRNAKTDRYRGLERVVARPGMRLWWMTGTPCPTGPDNAWAQARLVDPTRVPKFFGQFRARVMMEVSEHIWKPRAGSEAIAHAALQPAILFAKADCLDLPPMVQVDLTCGLSDDQARAYKEMATAMQVADRAAKDQGALVTAKNAADRVGKLRQIALGSLKVGDKDYLTYDYAPRLKVLLEAIASAKAKVVVIAPFKGILEDLVRKVGEHYSCALVNGDVGIARRNRIFADFKEKADPHVLLCHPEVMSHGLNLAEADTLIFFGPMYGNDSYRQVIERINRPPQDKKMTMVRIGCNALEWAIYNSLDADENTQQLILNLYKTVVGETS